MELFKKTREKVDATFKSMDEAVERIKHAADRMERCEKVKVGLLGVIALGVLTLTVQSFRD